MHPDQIAREKLLAITEAKSLLKKLKNLDPTFESYEHKVRCKRLTSEAEVPTKNNDADAGWDLYSVCNTYIPSRSRKIISTGISLQIPKEWVGLIWPRSGLSVKAGVDVLAGVIDSGYRGEIKVCLYNTSDETVVIQKGDRIAQILFQEVPDIKMVEVEYLTDSERGQDGFGSSGK
jgi:dUTP pyrophosphatase